MRTTQGLILPKVWGLCVALVIIGLDTGPNTGGVVAADGTPSGTKEARPLVIMETSEGTLKIELWPDKAPATVANFLHYVDEGFYDGTVFHRVIEDFVIQGGGLTADLRPKRTRPPIANEASAAARNLRGTIAMARTSEVHSATSQFFINVRDNPNLDHRDDTPQGFGYCVFGRVIEGMEVVDRIRRVKTTSLGHYRDVPETPIVIRSVRRAASQ